jgi:DNA-binding GntR family transcriptional regulator
VAQGGAAPWIASMASMSLRRLEQGQRVADRAFAAIHDAILDGEIPGGTPLRIRQLADQLGTSVMPVREAIKRLEELGLAESLPYRGAVVKEFTAAEMLELYEVRRLLETEAARRGAEAADAALLTQLRGHREQMAAFLDSGEIRRFLDADEGFLATLYAAAGNTSLCETVESLWVRCRAYKLVGARQEVESVGVAALLAFPDQLLAAAAARDGQEALQATADSLDASMARIRRALHEDDGTGLDDREDEVSLPV